MHERNYTEHQKKLRQRIIDHNNKDDIIIPIPLEFEQPINFDESF